MVRLAVNPKQVSGIDAPAFHTSGAAERKFLQSASLYEALEALRKACLLNVLAKARRLGTLRLLQSLLEVRQDRCFYSVDPALPEFLRQSTDFKSASNTLHEPMENFAVEDSFKSKEAHANIQFTFMRNAATGILAADVDIDESSGIEHGFEIIRNRLHQTKTHPYLIRELLLLSEPEEKIWNPGYRFTFK